jgi:hypothetical protein
LEVLRGSRYSIDRGGARTPRYHDRVSKTPFLLVGAAWLLASACSGLDELAPDEHVVAAPISARANVVLRHVVEDYASRCGEWGGSMSPGCAEVWATQFGYRAGVRRERDDLIELGEVTAGREAAELRGLAWDALVGGDVDEDDPAVFGFPALLVSCALGGRGFDGFLFERVLDEAVERSATAGLRERAGLAALLAASAPLRPDERDERLALARENAEASRGGGGETWRFLAWAAIARASGEAADAERARAVLAETALRFDDWGALALPLEARDEVLSRLLSVAHGMTDLSQATGDPALHRGATSLMDYVFSDAYFDGRLLIHDRVHGPSEDVCSGCNLMALYLADRLYGDSFVIAPLPQLPDRPRASEPNPEPPTHRWPTVLTLAPGTHESLEHLGVAGGFVLGRRDEPSWIELSYRIADLAGTPMLEAEVRSFFGAETTYELMTGFDEGGVARLQVGAEPLLATVAFTREETGTLSVDVALADE